MKLGLLRNPNTALGSIFCDSTPPRGDQSLFRGCWRSKEWPFLLERANLFGFFDFAVKMTAKQFLEIFLTLARVTGKFYPAYALGCAAGVLSLCSYTSREGLFLVKFGLLRNCTSWAKWVYCSSHWEILPCICTKLCGWCFIRVLLYKQRRLIK